MESLKVKTEKPVMDLMLQLAYSTVTASYWLTQVVACPHVRQVTRGVGPDDPGSSLVRFQAVGSARCQALQPALD